MVALDPTCQNTLQASAPPVRLTELLEPVMRVEPAWKMKTALGSPPPSSVTFPVRLSVLLDEVTLNVMVPVTPLVAIFWVKTMFPLMVPPLMGKHEPGLSLRNSKFEMLRSPLLPTVN